jgi:hypothetical protein
MQRWGRPQKPLMMPLEVLIEELDPAFVQDLEGLLRRLVVGPWLFVQLLELLVFRGHGVALWRLECFFIL